MSNQLLIPSLAPFYAAASPATYALLRAAFGLTIVTHGAPKLFGLAHGSMADPLGGSTSLIANALHLPFAPQLAMFVAVLETLGGLAVAIGLATRLIAPMLGIQMLLISIALGPTYPWIVKRRSKLTPDRRPILTPLGSVPGPAARRVAVS